MAALDSVSGLYVLCGQSVIEVYELLGTSTVSTSSASITSRVEQLYGC